MDQLVAKVNCRACGNTHYGLWSKDEGETVECPLESVVVATATGQVVVEEAPKPKAKTKTKKEEKVEEPVVKEKVEEVDKTAETNKAEETLPA